LTALLVEQILQGNRRAIARQISRLENNQAEALSLLAELYPHTGQAHLIGLTGPPGAGKSTLVNQMAKIFRRDGKTVAILSIDPTSPFTGGALLGDRIRLTDLAGDPGVFVRSMATRGSLGGLARAAANATKVFDAAGYEIILIETVGVGQDEVEIARLAHSVVVIETPGFGDEVQAIKAGVLEIADVFVVNKADREGADRTVAALSMMLELGEPGPAKTAFHHGRLLEMTPPVPASRPETKWRPPIYRTIATTGEGVAEVVQAVVRHRAQQIASGAWQVQERRRLGFEIQQILQERLLANCLAKLSLTRLNQVLDDVAARQLDPYQAVETLLAVAEAPANGIEK
jgi:LAO/AO transport system kinase